MCFATRFRCICNLNNLIVITLQQLYGGDLETAILASIGILASGRCGLVIKALSFSDCLA